jgi:ribosome recycling factor
MNNYVITEIDDAQKKMSAYVTLLSYRYMNLCVKAELGALMPVNIYIGDDSYNIEDVANIYSPDDFQFAVYPKNENNQQAIIQGVYEAHPEFKMEMKHDGGSYILYTMPVVDENRHDLLQNAIKGLYEECCGRIDAIHAEFKARMLENLTKVGVSETETDEALQALDDLRQKSMNMADHQLDQKQNEIDEALVRYQTEQTQQKEEDEAYDVTKGFRMYSSPNEE